MAEPVLEAVRRLQEAQQAEIDGLRRLCAHVVRCNSVLRRDHASLCVQHQVLLDCLDQSGELRPKVRALRDAQREGPLRQVLLGERCAREVASAAGAPAARALHAASRACVESLAAPLSEVLAASICQLPSEDARRSFALDEPPAKLAIEEPLALAWVPPPESKHPDADMIRFLDLLEETWPYAAPVGLLASSLEPPALRDFCAASRAALECVRHAARSGARREETSKSSQWLPQEKTESEAVKEVVRRVTMRMHERQLIVQDGERVPQEGDEVGGGPGEPAVLTEAAREELGQGGGGAEQAAKPQEDAPVQVPRQAAQGPGLTAQQLAAEVQELARDLRASPAEAGPDAKAAPAPDARRGLRPLQQGGCEDEKEERKEEAARSEEEQAAEEEVRRRLMEAERNRKQKAQKDAEIRRERQNGHAESKPSVQEPRAEVEKQNGDVESKPPVQEPKAEAETQSGHMANEPPAQEPKAEAPPPEADERKPPESPARSEPRSAEEQRELEEQARRKLMEGERNRKQKAQQDAIARKERERKQVAQEQAEQERKAKLEAEAAEKSRQEEASDHQGADQGQDEQRLPELQDGPAAAAAADGRPPSAEGACALVPVNAREAEEEAEEQAMLRAEEEEEEQRKKAHARLREQEREHKARAEAAERERAEKRRHEEERAKVAAEAAKAAEEVKKAEEEAAALRGSHPDLPFDAPSDGNEGEEGWAEISVEDVFAEALHIAWPGVESVPVESYTVQARLARKDGAPACRGWTRTGLKEPQALLNELPEACDLEVRVAAYFQGADPAQKPSVGQWFQVRTFELDLSVENLAVDPEGNQRGQCAESKCRGYISTEAQDPCTETESMPLCARCGVEFGRHCLLSADGEPLPQLAAAPAAAPAGTAPPATVAVPMPPALAPPAAATAAAAAPYAPPASGAAALPPAEDSDDEPPPNFKRYCIVSSWDENWGKKRDMGWNKACKHYECNMEITEEGEESFQILLDGKFDRCVHPNRQDACPHIDYKLCGPDGNGHELNWTIGKNTLDDAAPGDRFKIRFFVQDDGKPRLVDWQRLSQSEQRRLQEKLIGRPLDIKNESTIYRKLRWNNLTEDLHIFYRAGEASAIEAPVGRRLPDSPPDELTELLKPVRERVTRTVREKLAKYDAGTQFPRPEDAQHAQREGYELDLLAKGLQELRDTIQKHYNYGCTEQVWRIVGGENKGGLKVRVSKDLKSDEKEGLLATGSLVKEVTLIKDRLNYKLLSGTGPADGWISTKIKLKTTAVKVAPGELVQVPAEEIEAEESKREEAARAVSEEDMGRRRAAFLKEQQQRLGKVSRLRQERDSVSKQRAKAEAARESCSSCQKPARPSVDGCDEAGSFRCNACWVAHHRESGDDELADRALLAQEADEAAAEEEQKRRRELDAAYMRASLAEERLELRCASPGCSFCVHSDEAVAEDHCCPGCAAGGPHCGACEGVAYFAEDEDLPPESPPQEPASASAPPRTPTFRPRPEEPIVIFGLMAAHIATKGRLERFRHVLRSVKNQVVVASNTTFVFSLSWSSTEEFEDDVQSAVSSVAGPNMLAVHQMGRHSQFQHLRAALVKVEDALSERWASGSRPEGRPSIWVMFGDDDDIWHRRRVDSYAQAMRAHSMLDGAGIFVTTARAICQYKKGMSDSDLPVDEDSIESFMNSNRGKRMDKQPDTLEWQRICEREGAKVATMQLPDELTLEYFDFCPRLRLMHEFFSGTSEDLLAHRYCDLRFNEFLRLYPFKGREVGLEVAFFFPQCWMLFYATPIMEDDHVKKIIEKADDDTAVNVNNGHMSANYAVDRADDELGARALPDFRHFDSSVSQKRLSRYWAAFRNSVENYIVRHAGEKIDQRLFDLIVYISLQSSFFKFVERLDTMPDAKAIAGVTMMEYISQGYAKAVARKMDISVLWHRPNLFLEPPPKDEELEGPGPIAPPLGKALMPQGPSGYHGHHSGYGSGYGMGASHYGHHGMAGSLKQGGPYGLGKPSFGNGHHHPYQGSMSKGLYGGHHQHNPLGAKLFPHK